MNRGRGNSPSIRATRRKTDFLARAERRHPEAGQAPAEPLVELPLPRAFEPGIVEEVVGQRVQQAVREEARVDGDGPVEQQLKRVADPHVAQGLPQALHRQAGVERPGLPGEGDRGLEEGVPAEEAAVAVRPPQSRGTERLQPLADTLAPGAALALAFRSSLDLDGELVDQPSGCALVAETKPEAGAGPEGGELGRCRGPQPFVLLPQRVNALGEAGFLERDEEAARRRRMLPRRGIRRKEGRGSPRAAGRQSSAGGARSHS